MNDSTMNGDREAELAAQFEVKAKAAMRKVFDAVGVDPDKGFTQEQATNHLNGLVQSGLKLNIPGIAKYDRNTSRGQVWALSVEEFFGRLDDNHDGRVSLDEVWDDLGKHWCGVLGPEVGTHVIDDFCETISSKAAMNGKTRLQEVTELLKSAFDFHDKDRNGVLDMEEMRAGMVFFGAMMANIRHLGHIPSSGPEREEFIMTVLQEVKKTDEGKITFDNALAFILPKIINLFAARGPGRGCNYTPEEFFDSIDIVCYCLLCGAMANYLGGQYKRENVPGALGTAGIKAAGLREVLNSDHLFELCQAYGVESWQDLLLLEKDDISSKMGLKPIQARKLAVIIKVCKAKEGL